jgi:hypothetical protein
MNVETLQRLDNKAQDALALNSRNRNNNKPANPGWFQLQHLSPVPIQHYEGGRLALSLILDILER